MLDPELTFSPHINLVAQKCYYQLRQLQAVSRSLTHQSTLALVYAFVTSRIDCCSSLLVGLLLVPWLGWTECCVQLPVLLEDSITGYMCDVLHWLPISQQIQYRITAMVSRCVLCCAPFYLCCPPSVLEAPRVSFWSLGPI